MNRIEEIIIEHTHLAADIVKLTHKIGTAATEEEVKTFTKLRDNYMKRIEELRKERKQLIGK